MTNIRQATVDDLEKVTELNHKIFVNNSDYDDDLIVDFDQTPEGKAHFKKAIEEQNGCFLILEEDGQMVGYANGNPIDYFPFRKSRYFEIHNIGVIPEMKGKGFGKMLLEAITAWAKEKGYQKIYLNCYAKNSEAIEFYKRNGYSEIDVCLEKII